MTYDQSWKNLIKKTSENLDFKKTLEIVASDRLNKVIYPPTKDVYNVLKQPLENIKVVIIGQDPYHGDGQAHGYSFSVPSGVKVPPSLKNIYKEIEDEFKISMNYNNGNLLPWVEQGVFLLNTSLTVEAHTPASHSQIGWDYFTTEIIKEICETQNNVVFLLWGAHAAKLEESITGNQLILKSPHPSPFSVHRGFFGNGHFKKSNEYLEKHGKKAIDWKIT